MLYIALLSFGWISVCGASYSYGETDIFSLSTRSGMQIVWIATSIVLGFVIVMLDDRFYETFAFIIYGLLVLLLFGTIFNPHSIKGSHSWLVIGPLRLQPAEFAKFATALALAKFMSAYDYNINQWKHFAATLAIILMPMVCIVLQRETGSALVYLSFFLMFYREGMPGSILFTGVAMVIYFVVGIRYAEVYFPDSLTSVGKFCVLLLIQLFSIGMVWVYCNSRKALHMLMYCLGISIVLLFLMKMPFNKAYVQLPIMVILIGYLIWEGLGSRLYSYFFIALFALGSVGFFYGADFIMNNVMEPHQRSRINVLLGLDEDLRGAGYNVHQSEIAIGSGGLEGKGFLNGTQTKLKFVPEQDTDFIFCTVGERNNVGSDMESVADELGVSIGLKRRADDSRLSVRERRHRVECVSERTRAAIDRAHRRFVIRGCVTYPDRRRPRYRSYQPVSAFFGRYSEVDAERGSVSYH